MYVTENIVLIECNGVIWNKASYFHKVRFHILYVLHPYILLSVSPQNHQMDSHHQSSITIPFVLMTHLSGSGCVYIATIITRHPSIVYIYI